MKKLLTGPAMALILVVAFVVGLCAFAYPADAAPVAAPASVRAVTTIDWSKGQSPVRGRTIEIVDKVGPSKYRVSQAVEWLDHYTGSDMKTVSRCSGKAYRCITIRGGALKGAPLAMSYGGKNLIVIDTAKVDRRGYWSDASRKKIMAHELAHQFGLRHAGGNNLMATNINRVTMTLTSGQRSHLYTR